MQFEDEASAIQAKNRGGRLFLGVASISSLSRHPSFLSKKPNALGKQRSVLKRRMVEKNGWKQPLEILGRVENPPEAQPDASKKEAPTPSK